MGIICSGQDFMDRIYAMFNLGKRKPTRRFTMLIMTSLLAFPFLTPSASAQSDLFSNQCYSVPRIYEDILTDEYWLDVCQPIGRGCYKPAPPTFKTDFPDYLQSQTAVMEATKPNGFNAKVAVWTMWRYNPGYGWGAGPAWKHESTQNIQYGTLDPYPVKFGVPGLLDGEKYAVRVAFCNDLETNTNRRCTCTSDRSEDILTEDFAGSPPSGDLVQNMSKTASEDPTLTQKEREETVLDRQMCGWRSMALAR
jgi:hypothetical protein